jgi:hypothetical protein
VTSATRIGPAAPVEMAAAPLRRFLPQQWGAPGVLGPRRSRPSAWEGDRSRPVPRGGKRRAAEWRTKVLESAPAVGHGHELPCVAPHTCCVCVPRHKPGAVRSDRQPATAW